MAEVTPEVVTPVETPVAAPEATQQPESTADQVESPEGQEPAAVEPEKTLTQSEVNKLIAREKAKEAKRVERTFRAEAERDLLQKQLEARDRPAVAQPKGKPRPEDFAGRPYEEYVDAVADWRAEQKVSELREQDETKQRQQQEFMRMHEASQRLHKGAEKYPDFKEVVEGGAYISPDMGDAITRVSNPADVAYFLCQNHDEAQRIFSLPSPIDRIWAIRDVATKLAAPPAPTRTPAPIVPASPRPSTEKKLEDAESQEEFNAIRKRQIAARKR